MKKLLVLLSAVIPMMVPVLAKAQEYIGEKTVTAYTTGSAQDPHSKVNDIFRDEFGIIWIATDDGLEMFDGWRCDRLGRYEQHGLVSRNVSSVCGDKKGHLFFRFKDTISTYDYETEAFNTEEGFEITSASYFGVLYVTTRKQVIRYSEDRKDRHVVFSIDEETQDEISGLCINSDGDLFLTTGKGKIIKVGKDKRASSLATGCPRRIVADDRGNVWVCSMTDGLLRITSEGETEHFNLKAEDGDANNVTDICQLAGEEYLVSTYAGLFSLDTGTGNFRKINLDTNSGIYSGTPILRLYKDGEYVFMGTESSGIIFSSEITDDLLGKSTASFISGSDTPTVNAMAIDGAGRLWLATVKGLRVLPAGTDIRAASELQRIIDGESRLKCTISNVWTDAEGMTCWASTPSGIARISIPGKSIRWISLKDTGGPAGKCAPLLPDRFIISTGSGVRTYDTNGNMLEKLVNGAVRDFFMDSEGMLWISRLKSIQCSEDFHTGDIKIWDYDKIPEMSSKYEVTRILAGGDGTIWMGTNGCGVFSLASDGSGFKKYGYGKGLEDEHINDLAQSPDNKNLYIATDAGLSILDINSGKITNHDKNHGVGIPGAMSLCVGTDSSLYIAAHNGIIKMDCRKEVSRATKNHIKIKDCYINGTRLRPGEGSPLKRSALYNDSFSADWKTKSIKFRLANDNLAQDSPRNYQYQYMLEGLDDDFIISRNTTIDFNNLSPGYYKLIVKTPADSDEEPFISTVSFRIEPPFWKKAWFKTLVLLCIIFLLWQIVSSYRKYLEMRSALKLEQNNAAQEKAYADMKSEFTENITHEFRTPLTLINNYLESLMVENGLSRTAKENISGIYRNSEKLNKMIEEILYMNQENFDHLKPTMYPCDISEILSDAYSQYEDLAARRKLDFIITNAPGNTFIKASYDHLERAISNLLSNAFKYTRNTIILSFKEENGDYLISVKDNGCGIREESIPHIFERFWTEKNNVNDGGDHGFGIGLSYVKSIVEVHGGELTVSSIPGEETKFTMKFKKEDIACSPSLDLARSEEASNESENSGNDVTEKHLVLIVEDNKELMSLLARAFATKYEVIKAFSCSEGLSLARQRVPDIIISELIIPGMGGDELTRLIKNDPMICHIPVLLLSSLRSNETILQNLKDGAEDVIVKPFKSEVLLAKAANILNYRKMIHDRYQHDVSQDESMLMENDTDSSLIKKIVSIVEENLFNQRFDIEAFAKELCVSRPVLYRKIKAMTGMTPNNFIISIKLKKAAAELKKDPDFSVAAAATKYGFCSTSYFIKCFKKQFSETPLTYRNRIEKK